eukprot:TRINITY_DN15522_c0_g1_i3.p1 TRINITY_DN15522_c0_g1~~TRINITY_DN15522_c0_g1_i3.p1  ORF type:complete len:1331 (-),score=232.83 TRINITY_DN15522_c0_g1_i3:101-4042(-)
METIGGDGPRLAASVKRTVSLENLARMSGESSFDAVRSFHSAPELTETEDDKEVLRERASLAEQLGKGVASLILTDGETQDETLLRLEQIGEKEDLFGLSPEEAAQIRRSTGTNEVVEAVAYFMEYRARLKCRDTQNDDDDKFDIRMGHEEAGFLAEFASNTLETTRWRIFDLSFGAIVIVNLAYLGLVMNRTVQDNLFVGTIFLVVYIVEWTARWFFHGWSMRQVAGNVWMMFDLCVITASILELAILYPLRMSSNVGMLSLLRAVRVLRLFRLAKVMRLSDDLMMLIECVITSCQAASWAVVMFLVFCYTFGLLLFELLDCSSLSDDSLLSTSCCGNILQIILAQMQLATANGSSIMRHVMDTHLGAFGLIFFLVFTFFCSFGVLNLIVGVMLTAAISVADVTSTQQVNTNMLLRHKALMLLREMLIAHHKGDYHSPSDESPEIDEAALHTLCSGKEEGTGAAKVRELFQEAGIGKHEIASIFAELQPLLDGQRGVTVDAFIQGCFWLGSEVHPLDMLELSSTLRDLLDEIVSINEDLANAHAALLESSREIKPHLESFKQHNTASDFAFGAFQQEDTRFVRPDGGTAHEVVHRLFVEDEIYVRESMKARIKFDILWAGVVVVNVVLLGMEVDAHGSNGLIDRGVFGKYFISEIDHIFTLLYCVELFTRCILFYQVEVMRDVQTWFGFPVLMFNMKNGDLVRVFRCLPRMLREVVFVFELIVLAIGFFDIVVFAFGSESLPDTGLVKVIRFVRLVRMLRLVPLLSDLSTLVHAFVDSGPLLGYCFSLFCFLLYLFALAARQMLMRDVNDPKPWSSLFRTALSLLQIATFDDIGELARKAIEIEPLMVVILIPFCLITAFSTLNILTGIMVKAAYSLAVRTDSTLAKEQWDRLCVSLSNSFNELFAQKTLRAESQIANCEQFVMNLGPSATDANACSRLLNGDQVAFDSTTKGDVDATATLRQRSGPGTNHETLTESRSYGVSHDAKGNPGEVLQAMWASSTEVVVEFRIRCKQLAPFIFSYDPHHATLSWGSGQRSPAMVVVKPQQGICPGQEGLDNDGSCSDHTITGRLLFENTPPRGSFEFWFSSGYQKLTVYPVEVEGTKHSANAHVMPDARTQRGKETLTLQEFSDLLNQHEVSLDCAAAKLRQDQAHFVFQKLDVERSGHVSRHALLEALRRVHGATDGRDVASLRSGMRQAVFDGTASRRNARNAKHSFAGIVEALRGINLASTASTEKDTRDCLGLDASIAEASKDKLILETKSRRLRSYVEARTCSVNAEAKKLFMRMEVVRTETEDDISEIASLQSAPGAWD